MAALKAFPPATRDAVPSDLGLGAAATLHFTVRSPFGGNRFSAPLWPPRPRQGSLRSPRTNQERPQPGLGQVAAEGVSGGAALLGLSDLFSSLYLSLLSPRSLSSLSRLSRISLSPRPVHRPARSVHQQLDAALPSGTSRPTPTALARQAGALLEHRAPRLCRWTAPLAATRGDATIYPLARAAFLFIFGIGFVAWRARMADVWGGIWPAVCLAGPDGRARTMPRLGPGKAQLDW